MEARGVRTRQWRDRGWSARSGHAESAGDVILNVVEQSPKRNAGNAGGRRAIQQQLVRCGMPLASQRDVRPDGQDLAKRSFSIRYNLSASLAII
jgi:hypothetical protein